MHDFHFKYAASHLKYPAAVNKLDSSIQKCIDISESWSKIIILGFTDNRGNKLSNITLVMKRAEMLKTILVKKGIPA
jgi:outer membrane protein OmpA-like peptidoglycan-associated protein